MNQLYLSLLLVFPYLLLSQSNPCNIQSTEAKQLLSEYSKIDETELSSKVASLTASLDPSCAIAELYLHTIRGRINQDSGKIDEALDCFNKALEISKKENNIYEQKRALDYLAGICRLNANYEKALELCNEALALDCHADSTVCLNQNVKLIIDKSIYLRDLKDFDSAIAHLDQAIAIIDNVGLQDSMDRARISNIMGVIYNENLHDFKSAAESFKEAQKYCTKGHSNLFYFQNNTGNAYTMMTMPDSAIVYYNKTINATDKPQYTYRPLVGLGDIHLNMLNNPKLALDYFQQAYELVLKTGDQNAINNSLSQVGKAHYFLGNYDKALSLLNESLSYYDENKIERPPTALLTELMVLLSEIGQVDEKLSLKAKNFIQKRDSVMDVDQLMAFDQSMERLNNRIMRDSLNLKEMTIVQNRLELKNRTYGLFALLMGLLSAILGLNIFRRKYKEKAKENEELIFQNKELLSLNALLKKRMQHKEQKVYSIPEDQIKLEVKSLGKTVLIPPQEIHYIKSEDNGTRIWYNSKNSWTETKLKDIKKQLPESDFIQIFRSTLVNIHRVESINSNNLIVKGDDLKVGRTYKKEIMDRLKSLSRATVEV